MRKPIYFVTDQSFWSGCNDFPDSNEACRTLRIEQINNGINEWFNYFNEAVRPQIVIVYSNADLPSNAANKPIYLKIKKDYCGQDNEKKTYPACHKVQLDSPHTIIFDSPEEIAPHIAHEFGHALGRKHNDMPEGAYSIMSYLFQSPHVLPLDIKIMCETHTECPPTKNIP